MDLNNHLSELHHGDVEARRAAARFLWHQTRTRNEDIEPHHLEAALTDEDSLVRGHVTAALGDMLFAIREYDEPIPELDGVLARLTDEDEGVRQTVTGVLWNNDWWYGADAKDRPITSTQRELAAVGLVSCLHDTSVSTRSRASNELHPSLVIGHPDSTEATATVVSALGDDSDAVRRNVSKLLFGVAERRAELLDPHIERLQKAMVEDETARTALAKSLASMLDRHPDLVDSIVTSMLDTEAEGMSERILRLETLGETLATAPDEFERQHEVLATIESALTSRDRPVAARMFHQIAMSEPNRIKPVESVLNDQLSNTNQETRKHSSCALAMVLDSDDDDDDLSPALTTLVEIYREFSTVDSIPDPLVELAPIHPAFVQDQLEQMRARVPDLGSGREVIVELLETAPDTVRPFLEDCVADLNAAENAVREGAAMILIQVINERPDERSRYAPALMAAVDSPDTFDERVRQRLQRVLKESEDSTTAERDGDSTVKRDEATGIRGSLSHLREYFRL